MEHKKTRKNKRNKKRSKIGHSIKTIMLTVLMICFIMGMIGCQKNAESSNRNEITGQTDEQTENTTEDTSTVAEETQQGDDSNEISSKEDQAVYTPDLPDGVVTSDIYVEKIDGISDDFIRGVDISSVLSEEESGVVYYDQDGNASDLFKILADAGVNYIRVRVWNDPYDADGNGYGGGNNDTEKAAEIGRRAAEYGMKLLVDYHYSDFWADPSKQQAPKAWQGMTLDEMSQAAYDFTKESLTTILEAGADVGMVQIGNENNNGMDGYTVWKDIANLIAAGSNAVYEVSESYNRDILVAIHLTNPEDPTKINTIIERLLKRDVKFDAVALSYYPYWHGTLENLSSLMTSICDTYDKKVFVAETSYCYTLEDGDGHPNSVDEKDLNKDYTASVQSQANALRDVMAAVAGVGEDGLGVFYWEPAWIPVQVYDPDADNAAEVLAENKVLWETYGSGWASSYAKDFDPTDAGVYYGGSSWDNQALFDFYGHPLESLNVFAYVKYGTTTDLKVDFVTNPSVDVNIGSDVILPETVYVVFNDRSKNGDTIVQWNQDQIDAIDTQVAGEYNIEGLLPDGSFAYCAVKVALMNWITNSSFEEADRSMYTILYDGNNPTDYQVKESDAYSGTTALHFYSTSDVYFEAEQTLTGLEDGEYYFSLYAQGGDLGEDANLYIYAVSGDQSWKSIFTVDGWQEWQHPEITGIEVTGGTVTVGVAVYGAAKGWGTIDDFYLCKIK